jgi:hypothetical protein
MNIPEEYKGRYFYHFTHIDNIESIIRAKGLISTNIKLQNGINHHNVANVNIQNRRSEMKVTVEPGGVVHDYVPFYFASTNKMLLGLLNKKIVDQPYVVFIAVSIEKLLNENVIFTDASANTNVPPNFYNDPNDLNELSWSLIDKTKWKDNTNVELHLRMAEVLVHNHVPLEWIDSYIVFNDICKEKIKSSYINAGLKCPNISYDWFNNRSFFFTKFNFKDRKNETLVTGPLQLYEKFKRLIDYILDENKNNRKINYKFINIEDALLSIKKNFCVIPELASIFNLPTDNHMHNQSVSDHTIMVVKKIEESQYYKLLEEEEKNIVKLSAYFHDIGKGPKEKWSDGIQKAYADHPSDAIPMLARILTEEIETINEEQIKRVCLLVVYHDLIGDIIGKGRSKQELCGLNLNQKELYMLATLSEADINSVGELFVLDLDSNICQLITEVMR